MDEQKELAHYHKQPAQEKAWYLSPPKVAGGQLYGFMLANLSWIRNLGANKTLFLSSLVPGQPIHSHPAHQETGEGSKVQTCGVPADDDAQHLGVTVLFGLLHCSPELVHIQGPAAVLIQVIVHLDGIEFGDDR